MALSLLNQSKCLQGRTIFHTKGGYGVGVISTLKELNGINQIIHAILDVMIEGFITAI